MAKQRNAFYAGLFIVLSTVAAMAVIVSIKGLGRFTEPQQVRTAQFDLRDDLGGLRRGDDVRVGGYKVGSVRRIDLHAEGESPGVLVTFSMPQRIQIRHEARLAVQGTLTGASWLNFESLGQGELLPEATSLRGHPSSLSTVVSALSELAPELRQTVADVRTQSVPRVNRTLDQAHGMFQTFTETGQEATATIKHVRGHVDPMVDRYNTVTTRGDEALSQIRDLFGDTKADFRTTASNLSKISGTVNARLPDMIVKVEGMLDKVDTALDSTNVALEDIKLIGAHTRDAADVVRSVLVENRSRIDRMILSLRTTGDNLKAASAEIRRSPWRLLYQPKQHELANLNLYDTARQFAEGASSLQDSATALRDALQNPTIPPEQLQERLDHLEQTFGAFNTVEAQLWKQVKE
jgi:phospholipid/cholesterol/gamma-HCH transport system substrate-binding protein